MVETTVAYLVKNETVWKANPAFAKAVADLTKALAAIKAAIGNQSETTSGEPGSKLHTRELLEDLTSEIADQLFALSEETGDLGLAAATDFSRASLDRLSDDELEHTAKHVCELAGMHLGTLANYLVVAADIAELATLTNDLTLARPESQLPVFRQTLTASTLEERLRSASRILRGRVDKLVTRYRTVAPEFVSGYHHVRVVAGSPHRPTKSVGTAHKPPTVRTKDTAFVRASRN
jgi:hypothetical protein